MSLATFAHTSMHHDISIRKEARTRSREFQRITNILVRIQGKDEKSSIHKHGDEMHCRNQLLASGKAKKAKYKFLLPDMESWEKKSGEYHISDEDLFELLDLTKASVGDCCNTFSSVCKKNDAHTCKRRENYKKKVRIKKGRPLSAHKLICPYFSSNLGYPDKKVDLACALVKVEKNENKNHAKGTLFMPNKSSTEGEKILSITTFTNDIMNKKLLPPCTNSTSHGRRRIMSRKLMIKAFLPPDPIPKGPSSPETKQKSYVERDKRIEKAKQSRQNIHQRELSKLVYKLEKKQQTRSQQAIANERRRRIFTTLWTMKLASQMYYWFENLPEILEDFRRNKALDMAAAKIQIMWRKEMFARKAMEAHMINKKLKKVRWRIKIWSKCVRRRLNAQLIRRFLMDYKENQHMKYVIYKFRARVIKAQRIVRNFIECKRARLHALERYWFDIERHSLVKDVIRTKRRKKNSSLMDTPHRKVISNKAQHMENHLENEGCIVDDTFEMVQDYNIGPRSTGKNMSDLELCRTICRFHLEDSRLFHIKRSTQEVNDFINKPMINQSHAVILLSGKSLSIDWIEGDSQPWPFFMLYTRTKERLHQIMEELRCNEFASRKKVEERILKEECIKNANRFVDKHYKYDETSPCTEKKMKTNNQLGRLNENEKIAKRFATSAIVVEELREIFELVDIDAGGTVSCTELGRLFDLLGMHKETEEIQQMMHLITKSSDDDGDLTFEQFVVSLCNKKGIEHLSYSEEMVLCAFQSFATNTQGTVKRDTLMKVLLSCAGKWTKEHAHSVLRDAGLTANALKYVDFVKIIFQLMK